MLRFALANTSIACEWVVLMTDVKCIRCGSLSIGINTICKLCEIELNPVRPSSAVPVYYPGAVSSNAAKLAPIRPFNGIGDVIGPTFRLFTENFWLITKITFVIVAPFEIFKSLSIADVDYEWQLSSGLFLLDLLCGVLIAPALIYALMQVRETCVAPGINEAYRWGFSKLGKVGLSAALSWLMIGLGFAMCFIPGVVLTMCLFLVYPIATLEKGSVGDTIKSSFELTRGHRWNILGSVIVVGILMATLSVPAEMAGEYLISREFSFWPLHAAAAIFGDIIQQAGTVLSLVTYLSIRALWSQRTQ